MAVKEKSNGQITQSLKRRGFDESYYNRSSETHRVKCSQCEAFVVNGVPIHEKGCPNDPHSDSPSEDDDADEY